MHETQRKMEWGRRERRWWQVQNGRFRSWLLFDGGWPWEQFSTKIGRTKDEYKKMRREYSRSGISMWGWRREIACQSDAYVGIESRSPMNTKSLCSLLIREASGSASMLLTWWHCRRLHLANDNHGPTGQWFRRIEKEFKMSFSKSFTGITVFQFVWEKGGSSGGTRWWWWWW